jgi:dienelactone hydrolase
MAVSGFATERLSVRDVEIAAPDGVVLKATSYISNRPGPAVLLLHMCNSNRQAWDTLGRQLATVGIHALAVDYRGFGESGGEAFEQDPQKAQQARDQVWPGDMDAVLGYLMMQPGVDKARIGVAGASCGVNQAVQLARRHSDVKSLALLAGDTNRDGLNFLQNAAWLPLFTSAAADDQFDQNAPRSMQWLTVLSGNPRNRFVGFAHGKHGTEMFDLHPELPRQIVAWYVATLVKEPAQPNRVPVVKKTPAWELWRALNEDGVERAVRMFHEARRHDSMAYLFPEGVMNQLVYERIQAGRAIDAIELCRLWVEAYSASANAYDSLGDAYVADGQKELALQASERALVLLRDDPVAEPYKTMIHENAQRKVTELKGRR